MIFVYLNSNIIDNVFFSFSSSHFSLFVEFFFNATIYTSVLVALSSRELLILSTITSDLDV